MAKHFRKRLNDFECLIGSIVSIRAAAAAEILASAGYDWLFIDGEHGEIQLDDITDILRAVQPATPCLVRVPSASESNIKQVLDLGADGIIVPQVNNAEQAAQIVQWARYAPEGQRGVGLARAHAYGMNFSNYMESANERVAVVVQVEHRNAVENIEAIVEVPGIDAIQLGPYDLSASYGKMGQLDDPEIVSAIDRVISISLKAGIPVGHFGISANAIQPYAEKGCTLIVAGTDTLFMGTAARKMLENFR